MEGQTNVTRWWPVVVCPTSVTLGWGELRDLSLVYSIPPLNNLVSILYSLFVFKINRNNDLIKTVLNLCDGLLEIFGPKMGFILKIFQKPFLCKYTDPVDMFVASLVTNTFLSYNLKTNIPNKIST